MLSHFPVKDKIALVTGGASGIGLALVKLLAAQDAKVLMADLKTTPEARFILSTSPAVRFTECDVGIWSQLENLITISEREFGEVPDIYVPSAGIFDPPWSNFRDDLETSSYAQVAINLNHPIKLTRLALRALLGHNKTGVVCCVASQAGLMGVYGAPLYAATKHGVVGFIKSMGILDVDESIKVVGLCPTAVLTPLWTGRQDADAKLAAYKINENPHLTPQEAAHCILELIEADKYPGGTVAFQDVGKTEIAFPGMSREVLAQMPPTQLEVIYSSKRPVQAILAREKAKFLG